MTRSAGCFAAVVVCCSLGVGSTRAVAQEPALTAAGARRHAVADAIRFWVEDYDAGRLGPKGTLQKDSGLQPRYARLARATDLLSENDSGVLTHMEALHKLLVYAEADVDDEVAEILLRVAAAGFGKSLADLDAVVVRDAGHCVLMRVEHKGAWFLIMRAAAGELPLWAAAQEGDEEVDVARRVAALKLLGMKARPVFRSTIEGGLVDIDPRVRLAAVEAMAYQRRPEALDVLVRLLGLERHPIVSQAVVRAVAAALATGRGTLPADERDRAVRTAMRVFGRAGWRTDMDLIDFVEQFPHRSAVPALIDVLARMPDGDALVAAVNRDASPRLRARAHECLRGLTGAILPADKPEQWREFWRTQQHTIVVPDRLPHTRAAGNTASKFFGIPVQGREIAFVIDTSGSMKEPFSWHREGTESRRDAGRATRLAAAKEQLVLAVQAMDPESRYHVLTFSDSVQSWSRVAVPPTAAATRSLTAVLAQLRADGGTNIYAGLVEALGLDELYFGQEGKKSIDELFLLTDGEPTVGAIRDPDEILALVREANRYLHVRIHTVFAGSGEGAEFLQRLAAENDGVFVQR